PPAAARGGRRPGRPGRGWAGSRLGLAEQVRLDRADQQQAGDDRGGRPGQQRPAQQYGQGGGGRQVAERRGGRRADEFGHVAHREQGRQQAAGYADDRAEAEHDGLLSEQGRADRAAGYPAGDQRRVLVAAAPPGRVQAGHRGPGGQHGRGQRVGQEQHGGQRRALPDELRLQR